jgi:hypothetical protein
LKQSLSFYLCRLGSLTYTDVRWQVYDQSCHSNNAYFGSLTFFWNSDSDFYACRKEAGPHVIHFIKRLRQLVPKMIILLPTYGYPHVNFIIIWNLLTFNWLIYWS